jgi:hypothetical protein
MIKLDDWAKGDLWPFPYFRVFVWKWQNGKFQKVEADIANDFDELKFSSRHEANIEDKNDHTKDDIYSDMTVDSGGVCHFEPVDGDTDVIGDYIGRLVGIRTSGTRPWHSKQWFHYFVTEQSRFGRSDI